MIDIARRNLDLVRPAHAGNVIADIAEHEGDLLEIGQVIDDLELARWIGFGCRLCARGGEGDAERRKRAP